MKPKIEKKEKALLMRFWKKGSFSKYKVLGMRSEMSNLEKLGILEKRGSSEYSINREKCLEIQKDELKQLKLQ
jgi:hypothetical protein